MIDSNLRDTPALIYISCREPKGSKAERGLKPRFNLRSDLPSWPLRRLFDLCSGRITQLRSREEIEGKSKGRITENRWFVYF